MTPGQKCVEAIRAYLAENKTEWRKLNGEIVAGIIDKALPRSKRATSIFVPPTPDEVTEYSASIGYPMNGQDWCDHYETKGWKTSGSTKMVCWQAAVRKWKSQGWKPGGTNGETSQRQQASLGALQLQLGRVERELEDILRPGGAAYNVTPTGPKLERYHVLMNTRKGLKERMDAFGN